MHITLQLIGGQYGQLYNLFTKLEGYVGNQWCSLLLWSSIAHLKVEKVILGCANISPSICHQQFLGVVKYHLVSLAFGPHVAANSFQCGHSFHVKIFFSMSSQQLQQFPSLKRDNLPSEVHPAIFKVLICRQTCCIPYTDVIRSLCSLLISFTPKK